jgi:flagellar hook-associated protein 2
MAISASGLGSGLDIKSLVDQLVSAERQPVANRLALQEAKANAQLTALGRLKGALSTFQTAVTSLADPDQFQKRAVTVSDAERITAVAGTDATPAAYQVEVVSLAAAHRLVSGPFPTAGSAVGTGQLTVTSGADSMTIEITPSNNTLAGIRDAINASVNNPGVRATIVTGSDGAHLILVATEAGAANAITVNAVTAGSGLESLEYGAGTTNAMTQATAAADAVVEIDGFTVTSTTNRIEGAIEGVTIDLLQAEPGTLIDLEVAYDTEAARASVNAFVNSYNGVLGTIAELTAYNRDTNTGGALLGDAATRAIKTALREALGRAVGDSSDPFRTLAEIGITTGSNGRLSVDSERLADALAADFDGVGRVLADEDGGVAVRLQSIVDDVLGTAGRISARESTLRTQLDQIGDRRETLEARMEQVRKRYETQFNALDRLVGQLNQTSTFLTNQLANL